MKHTKMRPTPPTCAEKTLREKCTKARRINFTTKSIIISAILVFCFLIIIQTISAIPKIEPYVNDFGNLMTQEQVARLNLLADAIEQNTTWEIAMVLVPDTEGMDRLDYAARMGDENGVGKKDKDNGIVVLWSEGDDRGIAIATGRYSESIFNDAKVGRIARAARPYFDNKNYYEGFLNITLELRNEIDTSNNSTSNQPPLIPSGNTMVIIIILAAVLFAFVILPFMRNGSSSWGDGSGISIGSGSSSGSGGGFGSFGSGSFGGGGARG